jgi:Spy/CpxP family protein refolding chaperone
VRLAVGQYAALLGKESVMRKMVLAAGVVVLAVALCGSMAMANLGNALAQGKAWGKGPGMHPGMKAMAAKLGLTDDQKAQIKTILKAAHEQAKAAPDAAAKKQIMKDAFEKIKTTVLTDAQRQILADMKAKAQQRGKGGKGGKGHSPSATPGASA